MLHYWMHPSRLYILYLTARQIQCVFGTIRGAWTLDLVVMGLIPGVDINSWHTNPIIALDYSDLMNSITAYMQILYV